MVRPPRLIPLSGTAMMDERKKSPNFSKVALEILSRPALPEFHGRYVNQDIDVNRAHGSCRRLRGPVGAKELRRQAKPAARWRSG
jgi:hypothetical protein